MQKHIKRVVLIFALLALVLLECYIVSAFMPQGWQLAIQKVLPEAHDNADVTHPALSQEIDHVLSNHFAIKLAFYAVLLTVLIVNAFFIARIWKAAQDAFHRT
jgi:hypothetical protein